MNEQPKTYLVYVCPVCLDQVHGAAMSCVGFRESKHARVRVEARKAVLATGPDPGATDAPAVRYDARTNRRPGSLVDSDEPAATKEEHK
jgi:hypothetical protein